MTIVDSILKGAGLTRIKDVPLASGISGADSLMIWGHASKKAQIERAMNMNSGWVYACTRAIAEEVAKIKFRLYEVRGEEHIEIFEHPLLELLDSVNPHQTRFELLYTTAGHLELTGNAYWLLDGVKDENSIPKQIFALSPKNTRPIKRPLPEFIGGYIYSIGAEETTYEPYEILHFKTPDLNDPYEGLGTVEAILDWVEGENAATLFNQKYFKNGARLSGVLETENAMAVDQQKILKKSFEEMYAGVKNAFKIAVLPKGVKYSEKGTTPKDMEFNTGQTTSRDKILAGFRVPKTILGASESETNRATAETADYVFSERTIKPKMELLVQQLNEFLVPRFGENLYLDFHSPTPEDLEAKMKELTAALPNQASMSINEVRERYFGLGPIEGGDEVMGNFSNVPIGAPKSQPKAVSKPGTKRVRKPIKTRFAKNAEARKKMSAEIGTRLAERMKANAKEVALIRKKAGKDITELSEKDFEVLYKAFFSRVSPYESATATAVRRFNAQQLSSVLESFPQVWGAKSVSTKARASEVVQQLLGITDWPSILITLSLPALSDLLEKEGIEAAKLVGTTFAVTEKVRTALEKSMARMAKSYTKTSVDLLQETISAGMKDGVGLDEMTGRISKIYEFSDQVRAEQVARTEVFRVANESTRMAWEQSGVVKTLKWYTAADERTCPYCEPMHGKIVSIEDSFFKKGDTAQGSDGTSIKLDYSSVDAPPLHVSCRCYIRPDEVSIN